jgi:hypothetical protein
MISLEDGLQISGDVGYTMPFVYISTIGTFNYELNNFVGYNKIMEYFMTDKVIIKNLINNFDYLNEYISYLSGNYSKKEFKEVSKKYAKKYDDDNITDSDIVYTSKLIRDTLSRDYSDFDTIVAAALNISPEKIENTHNRLLEG